MKRSKIVEAAEAEERKATVDIGEIVTEKKSAPPEVTPAPPTPPAPERKRRAPKENLGLFIFKQFIPDEKEPDLKYWGLVSDPMPSTAACIRHIKENGAEFEGSVLMIAQVRKISKVESEIKRKITF